ncbi:DUF4157 domain-containing protein [Streptomyces sp. CB03911]|uniref:eCIS core domain-containing protein n=1 Tax=Streptomyces sp. CB03911 TaxID=1804758 RepID=UPI000B32B992
MKNRDEEAGQAVRTGGRPTQRAAAPAAPGRDARPAGAPADLAFLQRSVGNAAVARALDERHHAHGSGCGHEGSVEVQRSAVHEVLRGSGRPLDAPVRADMEARLGADFSDVRVHTGSAAERSAAEIGAHAYTSGTDVVIGRGGADRHTLAHELTHVIQQRSGPVAGTDTGGGLRVSDPSDRFEREAESNATRALAGPPAHERTRQPDGPGAASGGGTSIQRVPRYPNPRPGDQENLTEHHIVPYSLLDSFLNAGGGHKAGGESEKTLGRFMPAWKDVTLGELTVLGVLRKGVVSEDRLSVRAASVVQDGLPGGEHDEGEGRAAMQAIMEASEVWQSIVQGSAPGTVTAGGDQETRNLSAPYYFWAPFNLFVGPKDRTWDPGAGFDEWAQYCVKPKQYTDLKAAFDALTKATRAGADAKAVEDAHDALRRVVSNHKKITRPTPYAADEWTTKNGKFRPQALRG